MNINKYLLDNPKSALTCVSGYWKITNKHGDQFDKWFHNTLTINCPYVFFTDKETIKIISQYRGTLPTYFVECNIEDFYTYKYRHLMTTDPVHCPSVELNLIWNEKLFFIEKAAKLNIFNSDYFMWIDAGICTFRSYPPPSIKFPNIEKLKRLPKDKFIYCSSLLNRNDDPTFHKHLVQKNIYYHFISGTYILHKSIINKYVQIYKEYLDRLIDKNNIWTDQVILTHIYNSHPDLFYKLCNGYGEIINELY